jgi:hypothetical protein
MMDILCPVPSGNRNADDMGLPRKEKDTPPSVRSDDLLAVYIPADLEETFSDFVTMACAAIDGTSRSEWSDDERRIFEWMQKGKWKSKASGQSRSPLDLASLVLGREKEKS